MNKDEMIKNDRRKIMDLLYKLKRGELCTPNCYGCCGDNELSFAYCPDVTDNFEKELANLGYRQIADDEIVIKKRQYEQLKKYNRDRKRLRLKWQQAKQETAREIINILTPPCKACDANWHKGCMCLQNKIIKQIAQKYGIKLEDNDEQRRN